jgi:hypothetical protein
MIEHKKHVIFDEITYDRPQLETFVKKFNNCIITNAEWQTKLHEKELHKDQHWSPGPQCLEKGYNVVDTTLLEGKFPLEYPEIQNLKDKFKIDIPDEHVLIHHYGVGFSIIPHTDHNCRASIMFPIMPKDGGAELVFHDIDPPYEKAQDFSEYQDKVDYTVKYSTQHPTAINALAPHSVVECKEPRIYLRFMIFNYTYDEIKSLCKEGKLF